MAAPTSYKSLRFATQADATSVAPSTSIWQSFNEQRALTDHGYAVRYYDDFSATPSVTGAPYDYLGDVLPAPLADFIGGAVSLAPTGTDNFQTILGSQCDTFVVSDTASEARKLWFEMRVRTDSITDCAMAFGLAANADIALDFLADDTGALVATADFIGFRSLCADPDGLDFAVQKGSQTQVVILNEAQVLAVDTFYKIGFVFDPSAPTAKRIKIYINGLEQSTYGTGTQIAAATFPDSINMGIIATVKTGSAAAVTVDIDWIKVAQLRIAT